MRDANFGASGLAAWCLSEIEALAYNKSGVESRAGHVLDMLPANPASVH